MRPVTSEAAWIQQDLLVCGILAPLVYVGTDRLAGSLVDGYSFSAQSMSDLGASGSPVRSLVLGLTCVACALMVAFAVGAVAFGGWLRILSIAIPVGHVVLAVLRFATAAPATERHR